MLNLILLIHLILLHFLDCNHFLSDFILANADFTESAPANDLELLEILNRYFFAPKNH